MNNKNSFLYRQHGKENLVTKDDIIKEFTKLRATEDDFKREYLNWEVDRYISENYEEVQTTTE